MPLYRYECPICESEADGFNSVAERHNGPGCAHCKAQMRLVIMPTMVQTDLPGYVSTATGRYVEGRKARRDDLARSGCRPWEGRPQEEREAARQRAHEERKSDDRLEAAARGAYSQLSPEKRALFSNPGPID